MQEYIIPFVSLLLEMAPYLLLGFLVAGLLHAFVPPSFFSRHLSGPGFRPVVNSALMGVPLPLCSCGVIPTAMGLRKSGASRGATVSFLISTPQTGVDSILATAATMGLPMALMRPVIAFVTAIFGGSLVSRFCPEPAQAKTVAAVVDERRHGFRARIVDALHYGFVDMMQDVGKWLTIGLVLAGIIAVAVPDGFLTGLRDYPLLNMLLILVVAVPMYVCATGSIPVAMALMLKGLSPGAALVFLMAGPATNAAAMIVIGKALDRRAMVLYTLSIVLGAIVFGLVIDYLLPASWFALSSAGDACCEMDAFPWWKILSAVIFVILLINAMLHKHQHHHETSAPDSGAACFIVKGMQCNHCKASVERTVGAIDGVTSVDVNLADGTVTVSGNVDPATVVEQVEGLGFNCSPADDRH